MSFVQAGRKEGPKPRFPVPNFLKDKICNPKLTADPESGRAADHRHNKRSSVFGQRSNRDAGVGLGKKRGLSSSCTVKDTEVGGQVSRLFLYSSAPSNLARLTTTNAGMAP